MATNSSVNFTSLDFDTIKQNLKDYLSTQSIFKDYDFDASNMSVLLDLLAYNTQLNAHYLNMIGNEMFMDTALLRDSVVSHAKELNYVPRSFRSAQANVDITLTDTNPDTSSIIIPRGTTFTGSSPDQNFTFSVDDNVVAISTDDDTFVASNVLLYEGDYTSDTYVMNYQQPTRFLITNRTVDINSLLVTIIEDNGQETLTYKKADSLFDLDFTSRVYFIQGAENETYEVIFGDDVIGRKPKDRSVVVLQYRKCNGELPNGIKEFTADGDIGTATITKILVNSNATGGSISESMDSIKYNAPRAFTLQERVVTSKDYETILKQNFSEINAVSAYGGEEANPPQYGKVFVAVDLKNTDSLPDSRRRIYERFLSDKSVLAIDPIFTSPDYVYAKVTTTVKYNINETSLNIKDMESIVRSAIQSYDRNFLNKFDTTLYYSKLVSTIDNADLSIVSNNTKVLAVKTILPDTESQASYDVDFDMPFDTTIGRLSDDHGANERSIITSSIFRYQGKSECFLEDDGNGILRIMSAEDDEHKFVEKIGTVNYARGRLQIQNFKPTSVPGNTLDIYAETADRDLTAINRTILSIRDEDIDVNIIQVRV